MQAEYDNINVECVDIVKNPGFYKQYYQTSAQKIYTDSVVIESGSEFRIYYIDSFFITNEDGNSIWAYQGEYKLVSAILSVTDSEMPPVYFTASHGEKVGVGTILASAEYHRLAQIEDIAPYVIPYQKWDNEWVRNYVGDRLYEPTLKEHENDALAKVTPEALSANWPKIRKIVAQIPTAEALYETMAQLGAKRSLSDIGISEDKLPELLDNSPLARNRLTLVRMRRMMNLEV
jgi:glycerol-1-phosphate dehydrogenase [NAD(P)+]